MPNLATVKIVAVWTMLLVSMASVAFLISRNANSDISPVQIACVGDSITEVTGYPSDLQSMLGYNYAVKKFGVIGATILLNTDRPFLNQTAFFDSEQFQPQIVVIMLGTNDARINIYQESQNLEANCKTLISAFQGFASKPEIFVATPPPIFNNTLGLSSANLVQGVIPRILQVAHQLSLPVIDVYSALSGHPECFPDGVHPNADGAQIIANSVYQSIKLG